MTWPSSSSRQRVGPREVLLQRVGTWSAESLCRFSAWPKRRRQISPTIKMHLSEPPPAWRQRAERDRTSAYQGADTPGALSGRDHVAARAGLKNAGKEIGAGCAGRLGISRLEMCGVGEYRCGIQCQDGGSRKKQGLHHRMSIWGYRWPSRPVQTIPGFLA